MPSTGAWQQRLTHLGTMPIETFLSDYWQQKPLLIRDALPHIPLVEADELAGYSLEENVESRVLVETPARNPLESQWQLHAGPFDDGFFGTLPERHWTLLIQAVDQLHPQIHQLLHQFRFLPNWRVDDVMVSYAADGGSVGPHFDYYDVFLLQASGRRRWKLGQTCSAASELRSDTDCKILTEFQTVDEWLVQPGDLLYIPPNIAHWGIAEGDCVTYSVGFRAPSYSDILLDFCEDFASHTPADQRFTDPGRRLSDNPGEISETDVQRVREILMGIIGDNARLRDWFGRYMTEPQRQSPQFEVISSPELRLSPQVRAAYASTRANAAMLYINGEQFPCSLRLAQALCNYELIDSDLFERPEQQLLTALIERDWLQ